MTIDIFKNLILNLSMLVIIAQLLTKTTFVKQFMFSYKTDLKSNIALAVIFGLISILSTYTGINVNGAIVNTRVIGVMSGGIIGGPIVGIGAAIIGGLHRYFFDVGGFTAAACAISTFVEGIMGVLASKYLKRNSWKMRDIFLIAALAEIFQMIIILLVAKPYWAALATVKIIAFPMILFNSLGMVIFISVFNSIFIEQDNESAKRIKLAFDISEQCLPFLRKGIYNKENMDRVTKMILENSRDGGVVITDRERILSYQCEEVSLKAEYQEGGLPEIVREVIAEDALKVAEAAEEKDVFYEHLKKFTIVGAPLHSKGNVVGVILVFTKKFKISIQTDKDFVDGLSKLFSTQLELVEAQKQRELLQKAEFKALQSQINPHFLFNALNTITAFCREKPDKARELLIVLSTYFRNILNTNQYMIDIYDEFSHVDSYLQLEKARFDDRLTLIMDVPRDLNCQVPSFILQPIVENAVKHGAMKRSAGTVEIKVQQTEDLVTISVKDSGQGIPQDIIDALHHDTLDSSKVGLSNVDKRLRSIYGQKYGLDIKSAPSGTEIIIRIPMDKGAEGDENSNSG
ncbi:sensor histidine kinase YpdA [Anaerotignum neopropionicum]|uniref:histidine kinase n=1 Tax=Anaerotignum neopropionicum TaxID=36847 RepID=A0A136WHS9_9FIRM|nr:LytS/YhcK type 5TM receptor domain-containing protein [Anaerotignum neopropionicum]KXL54003.1 sensor histidine kinase YpdA [Anaerotignum neopropionicum]